MASCPNEWCDFLAEGETLDDVQNILELHMNECPYARVVCHCGATLMGVQLTSHDCSHNTDDTSTEDIFDTGSASGASGASGAATHAAAPSAAVATDITDAKLDPVQVSAQLETLTRALVANGHLSGDSIAAIATSATSTTTTAATTMTTTTTVSGITSASTQSTSVGTAPLSSPSSSPLPSPPPPPVLAPAPGVLCPYHAVGCKFVGTLSGLYTHASDFEQWKDHARMTLVTLCRLEHQVDIATTSCRQLEARAQEATRLCARFQDQIKDLYAEIDQLQGRSSSKKKSKRKKRIVLVDDQGNDVEEIDDFPEDDEGDDKAGANGKDSKSDSKPATDKDKNKTSNAGPPGKPTASGASAAAPAGSLSSPTSSMIVHAASAFARKHGMSSIQEACELYQVSPELLANMYHYEQNEAAAAAARAPSAGNGTGASSAAGAAAHRPEVKRTTPTWQSEHKNSPTTAQPAPPVPHRAGAPQTARPLFVAPTDDVVAPATATAPTTASASGTAAATGAQATATAAAAGTDGALKSQDGSTPLFPSFAYDGKSSKQKTDCRHGDEYTVNINDLHTGDLIVMKPKQGRFTRHWDLACVKHLQTQLANRNSSARVTTGASAIMANHIPAPQYRVPAPTLFELKEIQTNAFKIDAAELTKFRQSIKAFEFIDFFRGDNGVQIIDKDVSNWVVAYIIDAKPGVVHVQYANYKDESIQDGKWLPVTSTRLLPHGTITGLEAKFAEAEQKAREKKQSEATADGKRHDDSASAVGAVAADRKESVSVSWPVQQQDSKNPPEAARSSVEPKQDDRKDESDSEEAQRKKRSSQTAESSPPPSSDPNKALADAKTLDLPTLLPPLEHDITLDVLKATQTTSTVEMLPTQHMTTVAPGPDEPH